MLGIVVDTFRDSNADAVRRLAEKVPDKSKICSGNRSGDICRGVAETDWEYLGPRGRGEKGGTKLQDTFAVCSRTFRKDDDSSVRVSENEGLQVDELSIGMWV